MNSILLKIRCSLNPKAQAVNKAQRQLRHKPYFTEFVKSRDQWTWKILTIQCALNILTFKLLVKWFVLEQHQIHLYCFPILQFYGYHCIIFSEAHWVFHFSKTHTVFRSIVQNVVRFKIKCIFYVLKSLPNLNVLLCVFVIFCVFDISVL